MFYPTLLIVAIIAAHDASADYIKNAIQKQRKQQETVSSEGICSTMIPPATLAPDNSTCWDWYVPPPDGKLKLNAPSPPTGCDYKPCQDAVCACDSYCCSTAWDLSCRGYYIESGDTLENNYFVPGCSAKLLCCEQESAFPDPPVGGALPPDQTMNLVSISAPPTIVNIDLDIKISTKEEYNYLICEHGSPNCCDTLKPPAYMPPNNSSCWLWWDEPLDGVMTGDMDPPPKGCDYQPCQDAVCACDSYCCDSAWDLSCRGYEGAQGDSTENNYFVDTCSAKMLCCEPETGVPKPPVGGANVPITTTFGYECEPGSLNCCDSMTPPALLPPDNSTCWQWWDPPSDGVMKSGMEEPTKGCNYKPCEDVVCACDSYCCTTAWDLSCRGYYMKSGDTLENNYFVFFKCSAKILCCEPESAYPDPPLGGANPPNPDSTDNTFAQQCTPGESDDEPCCETMLPPSKLPPSDSTCWLWWTPPADGVMTSDISKPPTGCDYTPCENAVCACDSYCCDTAWDESCRGYDIQQGDELQNNYFVDGCSAEILCCNNEMTEDTPNIPFPDIIRTRVPADSAIFTKTVGVTKINDMTVVAQKNTIITKTNENPTPVPVPEPATIQTGIQAVIIPVQVSAPTQEPTSIPTSVPTKFPTAQSTNPPTTSPTDTPIPQPITPVTTSPTNAPTLQLITPVTSSPTDAPTPQPITSPTAIPTNAPITVPVPNPEPFEIQTVYVEPPKVVATKMNTVLITTKTKVNPPKKNKVKITIPVKITNTITKETNTNKQQQCPCPPLQTVPAGTTTTTTTYTTTNNEARNSKGKAKKGSRRHLKSSIKYSSGSSDTYTVTQQTVVESATTQGYFILSNGCKCPCQCQVPKTNVFNLEEDYSSSGKSKKGRRNLKNNNNTCSCNNMNASSISYYNTVNTISNTSGKGKSGKRGRHRY